MTASQILVTIPYAQKDAADVLRLLKWVKQLSPKLGPHCCLLAADASVMREANIEILHMAREIFYTAEAAVIPVPAEAAGWPKAANAMFRITSLHIEQCFRVPFFWMEPDCTPLVPSWLDEIAVHYGRCPKRFMGDLVRSNQPNMPKAHVAGCAVYPSDAGSSLKGYTIGAAAWDIAAAEYMVSRCQQTPLIHHHYGTMELAPTFRTVKQPTDAPNVCTLDFIRHGAVVFHRCKDGSLIDVLRQKRDSEPKEPVAETSVAPQVAKGKRGPGRPRKQEAAPAANTA